MFKVANPIFLVFLIVAVLILLMFLYGEYRKKRQMEKFGNIQLLSVLMPTRSLFRQRIKFFLIWFSFIALILVTSRLQFAHGSAGTSKKQNVEVVAVVDVSNSMLCTDVAPSRLELAKQTVALFVDESDNAKLGLVEFAGLPVTKMPMTSDYGSAKMFINSMSPEDISTQGTAIGAALRQAQKAFSKDDGVARSIVLITDAENHEDDAVATAKEISKDGIQINVVGLGSPEGALVKLDNDSILHDSKGAPVLSKLDTKMAKEIAEAGNGAFIETNTSDAAVQSINNELKKLSDGTVDSKSFASFSDQFETFAWIAFVLLLLDLLIMERKNKFFDKLNLFSRKDNLSKQKKETIK